MIVNIEDKTLKAILKYKNYSSIIAIRNNFKCNYIFYFRELKKPNKITKKTKQIEKEIHKLNTNKVSAKLRAYVILQTLL